MADEQTTAVPYADSEVLGAVMATAVRSVEIFGRAPALVAAIRENGAGFGVHLAFSDVFLPGMRTQAAIAILRGVISDAQGLPLCPACSEELERVRSCVALLEAPKGAEHRH